MHELYTCFPIYMQEKDQQNSKVFKKSDSSLQLSSCGSPLPANVARNRCPQQLLRCPHPLPATVARNRCHFHTRSNSISPKSSWLSAPRIPRIPLRYTGVDLARRCPAWVGRFPGCLPTDRCSPTPFEGTGFCDERGYIRG
jgi:hypothetical protein